MTRVQTINMDFIDTTVKPSDEHTKTFPNVQISTFENFKQYIRFTRFKNNHRLQKMFTPCSNSFLLSAQKIACLSKVKRILPVFVKIPYLKLLEDYFVKFLNISVFTLERELWEVHLCMHISFYKYYSIHSKAHIIFYMAKEISLENLKLL